MGNPQRQGNLAGPLVVVMAGPAELIVVKASEADNAHAEAQMYELDVDQMLDQIKPLPIWLKFIYGLESVEPPVPFTPELVRLKVEAYQAAKRARMEADNG